MKVTEIPCDVKGDRLLDVCFDVGKRKLNCLFEAGGKRYEDEFPNRSREIGGRLGDYQRIALGAGFAGLRVVCEPTGGYERNLMRIAKAMGHGTAYVSSEATCKLKMLAHGDPGKTDARDTEAVRTAAACGKTLSHDAPEGDYALLREANSELSSLEGRVKSLKCHTLFLAERLLPGLPVGPDFLHGRAGAAVLKAYGWMPGRIVAKGKARLVALVKKAWTGGGNAAEAIWDAASAAAAFPSDPGVEAMLARRLSRELAELGDKLRLIEETKEEMAAVYARMRSADPRLPAPVAHVVSAVALARIFAESGPFSRFRGLRQLYRQAGLNLCENKSGAMEGRTRIGKKGRTGLRRAVAMAVFPLVRGGGPLRPYHLGADGSGGAKRMVAMMRRFLRMLHGWWKSGKDFDPARAFPRRDAA